jgi:hypothetical protein
MRFWKTGSAILGIGGLLLLYSAVSVSSAPIKVSTLYTPVLTSPADGVMSCFVANVSTEPRHFSAVLLDGSGQPVFGSEVVDVAIHAGETNGTTVHVGTLGVPGLGARCKVTFEGAKSEVRAALIVAKSDYTPLSAVAAE